MNGIVVKNEAPKPLKQKELRPSILFIDEVDVFFEKKFFGELYRPITMIYQNEFRNVLEYVWSCKN